MKQILKTPISLPLGEILGVSRELTNNLQDIIRYKNPISKPPPPVASQKVYNIRTDEQGIDLEDVQPQEKEVPGNRLLIKLTLYC